MWSVCVRERERELERKRRFKSTCLNLFKPVLDQDKLTSRNPSVKMLKDFFEKYFKKIFEHLNLFKK